MSGFGQLILIGFLLITLFFVSRISLRLIMQMMHRALGEKPFVYVLISLLLFPGTIIHELSHLFMALVLGLRITDIHIFPQWSKGRIRLGYVTYVRKDVLRGILVGGAPFFVGIFCLWWFYSLSLFRVSSALHMGLATYLIYVISTTMFLSKEDMKDFLFLIPVLAVGASLVYIFEIPMNVMKNAFELEAVRNFLYAIRSYISIAIAIHAGVVCFLFITRSLFTHHD